MLVCMYVYASMYFYTGSMYVYVHSITVCKYVCIYAQYYSM